MKKFLLLLAALACTGAIAQEKEIWACQLDKGALLAWEDNSSWEIYRLSSADSNVLLTVDGVNSRIKITDEDFLMTCLDVALDRVICYEPIVGSEYIVLDTTTGKAGRSFLSGAVGSGPRRDSVSAAIYNCTKF